MDLRHQCFVLGLALSVSGKAAQVGARDENHIDPGNGGDLIRDRDAGGRFDHGNHHDVVVGGSTIVTSPQCAVLAAALAALSHGRILGELDRRFDFLDCFDHGNDDTQRTVVCRFLDIAFGSIRHSNKRNRRSSLAGPYHPGHILMSQRTMLHLDPEKIESGVCHRAIDFRI